MAVSSVKKWGIVALVLVLVLVVGGLIGFQLAIRIIKDRAVEALGPESEIKELKVGWSAIVVEGLRIKGHQGWPAADTLRAERVVIVPSLRSLLSETIQIGSLTVIRPYLSALRTRDGKLQVLPSLLDRTPAKGTAPAGPPARSVAISRINLEDGIAELFDASVAQPPLKIRLEQIQGTLRNVTVPALKGKSQLDFAAVVKGARGDGRAKVSGWAEIATKDSSIKTELRSVDLVAFQPYLVKAAETRLQKGSLDLDLQSEVNRNQLRAPGRVTISDLEFSPSKGALDTFMGVPRAAVISFLKDKNNKITTNFIIEGDINNPHFTLNEAFATRVASSLAENLGVSIRGVAEGAGTLTRKGVEAAGEAAKGVGGAFQQLFGGTKKR